MALTWERYVYKVARTLFYAALLLTAAYHGYFMLNSFLNYPDDSNNSFLQQCLKTLFGLFLYFMAVILSLSLFVGELAEETEDDIHNTSRYAVFERKISTGFLKNTGIQTDCHALTAEVRTKPGYVQPATDANHFNVIDEAINSIVKQVTIDNDVEVSNVSSSVVNHPGIHGDPEYHSSIAKYLAELESNSTVTFKDVGGLDKLKNMLEQCVIYPLINPYTSEVEIPRAILLIGDKGAGKTLVVNGLVGELRMKMQPETRIKFYTVESFECLGPYTGCGVTFHDLFEAAHNASPFTILLFKNIDKLYDKSIPLFLSELESVLPGKVLILATCRCRELLDLRFLQSGKMAKFDYIFDIEPPKFWERVAILKIRFAKRNCPIEEQSIMELAGLTSSFTPGGLEELATVITRKAIDKYNSLTAVQKRKQHQRNKWAWDSNDHHGRFKNVPDYPNVVDAVPKYQFYSSTELETPQTEMANESQASFSGTTSSHYNGHLNFDSADSENEFFHKVAKLMSNKVGNKQYFMLLLLLVSNSMFKIVDVDESDVFIYLDTCYSQ